MAFKKLLLLAIIIFWVVSAVQALTQRKALLTTRFISNSNVANKAIQVLNYGAVNLQTSMKQIMERNWQGITVEHRGAMKGFNLRLDLTNVSYNENNGRFKAVIQKAITSRQGTFYDVSEYTGEFNPPDVVTFEHSRVINQTPLPGGVEWPNEYFSAKLTTDPTHSGHFVLTDEGHVRKIVFTTYPYRKK